MQPERAYDMAKCFVSEREVHEVPPDRIEGDIFCIEESACFFQPLRRDFEARTGIGPVEDFFAEIVPAGDVEGMNILKT
nr:hypothetical protein [Methanofollis sp.]